MKYTRTQNFKILAECFIHRIIRGTAKKHIDQPKNVLVIQNTRNIGDMICTTPVFRAVKHTYPDSRLIVMCGEKNKELLWGNKDIDEYIVADDTTSFKNLVADIRSKNIDFGASINPSPVDLAMMYLAGIPSIATFVIAENPGHVDPLSFKLIKDYFIQVPFHNGTYVPRQYLKILEPIGIETDTTKKYLSFRREADEKVMAQVREKNINPDQDFVVVISPGAGTKIKQWRRERFAEIANSLAQEHAAKIIIIGGGKDKEEVDDMIAHLDPHVTYVNAFNQSLDELKALLSHVHLIIANDSGPVYIAESFDVPTLVIVGPTDEAEHPPKGRLNRVVKSDTRGKPTLGAHLSIYNEDEARRQIDDVTVDMVKQELNSLLKEMGK